MGVEPFGYEQGFFVTMNPATGNATHGFSMQKHALLLFTFVLASLASSFSLKLSLSLSLYRAVFDIGVSPGRLDSTVWAYDGLCMGRHIALCVHCQYSQDLEV
jgi:hypothetical protein